MKAYYCKFTTMITNIKRIKLVVLSADKIQFINEFTERINILLTSFKYVYLNGDYNIDLLAVNSNNHADSFYKNVTSQGFSPKLTRPTRAYNNSHTLTDKILSNNLCKSDSSGILAHHVSDHFMSFCIVRGEIPHNINKTTHVMFEQIHPRSIANFKSSITNADIMSKLDMGPSANPNNNDKILSDIITTAKANHIPKKMKKKMTNVK